MFVNTKTEKHSEFGRTYAACGGETVTNLGIKSVCCVVNDIEHQGNVTKTLNFQVGDRVTRGLLAVSQLCCSGAGVWFGPGPEFKSCIVWDKNAFIAAEGPKSDIFVKSGTLSLIHI